MVIKPVIYSIICGRFVVFDERNCPNVNLIGFIFDTKRDFNDICTPGTEPGHCAGKGRATMPRYFNKIVVISAQGMGAWWS